MPIAIDLRSLMETGGKISGVENYLLNILRQLRPSETDFAFYNSFKDVKMPKLGNDIKIKRTGIPNKILNLSQSIFKRPTLESMYGNFSVLWMPDLRPFAINKKTKLAVNAHDLSPLIHPEFYSLKRRLWHKLIHHSRSFARADIIFTISEYTKRDLIKFFGLPENKIKVIYPGIDHSVFRADLDSSRKAEVKEKYILPEKYILSISTIEPRKNIAALVSAFELVNDPGVFLVIAGRFGWLYADLVRQISKSPKKNKIKLVGYINEEDKPYIMANAEIVAYPSFYGGFGFVPLEAMACGVPVVTSARTSMPEACADAALLVDPYNIADLAAAINNLLIDSKLRQNLIEKGTERAKKYNWQECARQIWGHLSALNQ